MPQSFYKYENICVPGMTFILTIEMNGKEKRRVLDDRTKDKVTEALSSCDNDLYTIFMARGVLYLNASYMHHSSIAAGHQH